MKQTEHTAKGNTATGPVRVSLDMESVLAAVHPYFLTVYNREFGTEYAREDIDGWDWVRTEVDFETFDRIVETAWRESYVDIEPTASDLHQTVDWVTTQPGISVDIVTARTGVEDSMQSWLTHHEISGFDSFIATEKSKAELGYDVFIDDKTGLADELSESQVQYLVSQPHNQSARAHDRTIVVPDVKTATEHLVKIRSQVAEEGE